MLKKIPAVDQIRIIGAHKPIIDMALFQQVQEVRASHNCPARYSHDHIFRGFLFCSCCGHALSVSHRKLKYREEDLYRCMHHFAAPSECPKTHAIYHEALSAYVLQQIRSLAKSMKRRKVNSPVVQFADCEELTPELLHAVIERIEVGHLGYRTPIGHAVRIVWKL